MHEDFEKYRPLAAADVRQLNVRIPSELVEKLKNFAKYEGDSLAGLVTEGIARVIEDRTNHPTPQMQAKMVERRQALLQQLETINALFPVAPEN